MGEGAGGGGEADADRDFPDFGCHFESGGMMPPYVSKHIHITTRQYS